MIAADEYYSKQRLEPPGSRASWPPGQRGLGILWLKEAAEQLPVRIHVGVCVALPHSYLLAAALDAL